MIDTNRVVRHLILGGVSLMVAATIYFLTTDQPRLVFRLSLATLYPAVVLISIALIIGPWNLIRRLPNPVSSNLRRDIGIWGGAYGLLHVFLGLQVHLRGQFWLYFVYPSDKQNAIPMRYDFFGFANYTGLVVTLILVMLLALSNNRSLRFFGAKHWKMLQRWLYVGYAFMLAHGVAYLIIEKGRRPLPYIMVFALLVVTVLIIQLAGMWVARQRQRQDKGGNLR